MGWLTLERWTGVPAGGLCWSQDADCRICSSVASGSQFPDFSVPVPFLPRL